MQNSARNRLIGLLAIAAVATGLGLWLLIPHKSAAPAAVPQVRSSTSYDGLDQLLNVGATSSAVSDFKLAMHEFLVNNPPIAQAVSLSNVQQQHDFDTGDDDYVFDVTLLSGTYQATLATSSLETARLTLTQSGRQVYQSADITAPDSN